MPGEVLVADMTDPDWEPIMKRAAAIVTNRGGRTCHAAIIARELGIPAVVGTGQATRTLADGRPVTVSCAEGDTGYVYAGQLDFTVTETELATMPDIDVKIMMNVGTPDQAFAFSRLPNAGVGLARLEFIINRQIGIHPKALLEFDTLDGPLRDQIAETIAAYASPREFFVTRVAEGVSMLAAAFAPHPVIVRMSDFKSNEYANLVGGERYEPHEENPMIGYRGASRYLSPDFADCFAMECEALRYVREDMGLTNVRIMIPFVRTLAEAEGVIALLAEHGLRRGENGLQVVMMCELPSNAVIADQFLDHFDGFSIGSNDMTQLTLGLDRDSALVAAGFDERDPAVKFMISAAIRACKARGKYVGICGQGPSDHPDLAQWLLDEGIESMSLNPDTVVDTWLALARASDASTQPGADAAASRVERVDDMSLAAELVREAGELAASMLGRRVWTTEYKSSVSDVVSAADHAAEELITARLAEHRGDDGLVGEEGARRSGDGRTWYVDPVDGTYNFLSGLPYWCSAVGLADEDGPLVGAVYFPPLDELWVGGRDAPTTLNGVPLAELVDRPLADVSVATYFHPRHLAEQDRLTSWQAVTAGRGHRPHARLGLGRPGRGGQRPARHLPPGQPQPLGLGARGRAGDRGRRGGRGVPARRRPLADRRQPSVGRRRRAALRR